VHDQSAMTLPSGTVTFLFTDVEGSTRLLHSLGPEGYAEALAAHRLVLRDAFATEGGVEVDTQGDAFFVAFPTAPGALAAAAAAARRLERGPIRVRMGIHSGTPLVTDEGYVGVDVHRAARIAACGHGGQILVSAASAGLVGADGLRDLGEHRLKDLSAPERIYQLGDAEFPPLRSLYRTNLPVPATPFLGRAHEVEQVAALLQADEPRLVALTGPGGVGKTRLALQAAAAVSDSFADGVFWVPLAPLDDPRLVLPAAAQAVGAKGGLVEHIGDRSMLLVVDNLEHVIDAASDLGWLLAACPRLHLLVTSRELPRLPGEQAYPVPELRPEDGVELFLSRAHAANPFYDTTRGVSELCARLDQLPLALELAAARARVLSPEQLLERLSSRLDLLKAGRGADARQQTLRATIEWSHELLDAEEKQLYARLAVFAGGWTLDAAEHVCETDVDVLQSLVDKSLVRALAGERFYMLETIREFANEQLRNLDASELRRRHADFFLARAEAASPALERGDVDAFEQIEIELPNFRVAFAWTLAHESTEALRFANAFRDFWYARGHLLEGRRWFAAALANDDGPTDGRALALAANSILASLQGDWPETTRLAEESRAVAGQLGAPEIAREAALTLARARLAAGDREQALRLIGEAEEQAAAAGDLRVEGMALFNGGYLALASGDYATARERLDASRAALERTGHPHGIARALAALGSLELHEHRNDAALAQLRASLAISRAAGDHDDMAWALELTGVALADSDADRAARLLGAAEALRERLGGRLEGIELALHERAFAALASYPQLDTSWSAGRALQPDEAAELALSSRANAS